jgi:hypothetical protein
MDRLVPRLSSRSRGIWWRRDAALVLIVLALAGGDAMRAAACEVGGSPGCAPADRGVRGHGGGGRGQGGSAADSQRPDVVSIQPASDGRTIPQGFVGVSLEYNTVSAYEGTGPSPLNPVLAQLIRNLAPGQTPVVRIGGDSTDWTWWPIPGMRPPSGVTNSLSPSWVVSARALALSAGARLILGINLEAGSTVIAAAEARQLLAGIGSQHVEALEIGNEPQLYSILPWFHTPTGRPVFGRPPNYQLTDYAAEFAKFARVLPRIPLAGPSIGHSWLSQLGQFLAAPRAVGLVTFHAYAINRYGHAFRGRNCSTPTSDPSHPTVATLLAPFASQGLMRGAAADIALAHSHGLRFRVDELNAITCAGTPGVSDTFASALWVLDALFALARTGVDGVNVHTWRGSAGKLFGFSQVQGQWASSVRPEYYGLLMFAQAAPPGSRILQTEQTTGTQVQSWAMLAPDRSIRLVLINNSLTRPRTVLVPATAGRAELERLQAPSAYATSGVTLAGRSFGAQTTTGVLAGPARSDTLIPSAGAYAVRLPAASAALLTIPEASPGPPRQRSSP